MSKKTRDRSGVKSAKDRRSIPRGYYRTGQSGSRPTVKPVKRNYARPPARIITRGTRRGNVNPRGGCTPPAAPRD